MILSIHSRFEKSYTTRTLEFPNKAGDIAILGVSFLCLSFEGFNMFLLFSQYNPITDQASA